MAKMKIDPKKMEVVKKTVTVSAPTGNSYGGLGDAIKAGQELVAKAKQSAQKDDLTLKSLKSEMDKQESLMSSLLKKMNTKGRLFTVAEQNQLQMAKGNLNKASEQYRKLNEKVSSAREKVSQDFEASQAKKRFEAAQKKKGVIGRTLENFRGNTSAFGM